MSGTAEAEPAPRDRELPGRNGTRAAGGLVGSSPPMPPPGLVSRPRLLAQMRAGTQGLVTLVSAPAGAGKTTLAAEWAAAADLTTVGWVAVEHEPDAHDAFWACVPTALGRCGVNLSTLEAGRPGDERVLLPGIVAPLTGRHEPVVLIVDCDEQTLASVSAELDQLQRDCGGALRLVILCRADPLLPLHRYRRDGMLTEIRMADLAFTPAEAAELFAGEGLELSPATADALTERTHGWAAGLRLAAMSLTHRPDPERAAAQFTGDRGTVADYLLAEVLDAQPAGARELLLRTSLLEVLRPGLVEKLGGPHAARTLSFLAHANAFVEPVPGNAGCFRYHTLFRDLLRAQLAFERPSEFAGLHRCAARWFAEHGFLVDAVRHAGATGDWAAAAAYVVEDLALGSVLLDGPDGQLALTLARLPAATAGAPAALVRAALAISRFDLDGCAGHLDLARTTIAKGDGDRPRPASLCLSVLELVHARARGDVAAGLAAAAGVELALRAQDPTRLAVHPEMTALIRSNTGALLLADGRLPTATDTFTAGAAGARAAGCEVPLSDCLGHLALIAALRGHLRAATATAQEAITVLDRAHVPVLARPRAMEVALAWVKLEQYELVAARRHVARAEQSAGLPVDPVPRAMLALVRARLRRAERGPEAARATLAEAGADLTLAPWLQDRVRSEEAALVVADGRTQLGERLLSELTEDGEPDSRLPPARIRVAQGRADGADTAEARVLGSAAPLHVRVSRGLLEASRLLENGQPARAEAALARSLQLAASETLRRPFLEADPPVRDLLRRTGALAADLAWVRAPAPIPAVRPAHAPDGPDPARLPVVIEQLSGRESEVLGHLAQLLTTEEIADAMFISVNTVRTHVRSILRKLGVQGRNEAVRRATAMHLLPERQSRNPVDTSRGSSPPA